ncbi:MAG: sulfatase-like hydrolase/transferase, partial [Gemmatimonadaceae bacterium]
MSQATVGPRRAERFGREVGDFARCSVGFFPVVLLVRACELALAGASHELPRHSATDWLWTLASDAALTLWVAALLALQVLGLAQWMPRTARALHRVVLVLVALLAMSLSLYFAATLVPLGADLYGYSISDIRETVGASGGVSVGGLLMLAAAAGSAWVLPGLALRMRWSHAASAGVGALMLVALAVPSLLVPAPSAFASETACLVAINKTGWFARRSAQHLVSDWRTARAANALRGYPLMHRVTYDDVLGPRLALGADRPNIVIVIVEGLGRDFTGPGASFGGFTPFLDSLTERSLSWDNFLSTSGRTFGILPSLLGSLPFGATGFMELGARMPAHASLVTLLKQQGYATSYFTGTRGSFDRIDAFMEREGVDRFVDAAGFGPAWERSPASVGGESWGYPDEALFARSLELLGAPGATPRLDVYLTISTHEPFIPPRVARYTARFEQRLSALPLSESRQATYRAYAGVFKSLLYADDALRGFLTAYAARADYRRTIFLITGDHRLIPVPPASRLSRFHVPFLLFSPMLREPRHVRAVSSHFDVLPSLLALLHRGYGIPVPDSAPWLGRGLDTSSVFRHVHQVPLMRTKNELDDFLDGTRLLAGDQFFELDSTFALTTRGDGEERAAVSRSLDAFRAVNSYVTTRDRLSPVTAMGVNPVPDPVEAAREDSAFRTLNLERRTPEEAFAAARELAERREFAAARLVVRRLLRDAPSYHDARALLGRTYAWDRQFATAAEILDGLVRRAPGYADGYAARLDVEIYQGRGDAALAMADEALVSFHND